MTHKIILRNKSHKDSRSHDVSVEKFGDKIVRFTYECFNSGKRFNADIFDGTEWKSFFTLPDLGVIFDGSFSSNDVSYGSSPSQRETDRDQLYMMGLKYVKSILSEVK